MCVCVREMGAQGDRTVFKYQKQWKPGEGGCMPIVSLFKKLFALFWGRADEQGGDSSR